MPAGSSCVKYACAGAVRLAVPARYIRMTNFIRTSAWPDAMTGALFWLDADGAVLDLNVAAEAMIRRTRRSVLGTPVTAIFPEAAAWLKRDGTVRGTLLLDSQGLGETLRTEASLSALQEDGVRLLEVVDARGVVEAARSAMELDVRAANAALIRNLAHEIKNPLGGIRGAAQLLRSELTNADDIECVEVILAETERLLRLTERMLSPYRPGGVRKPVDAIAVLERVRRLAEKAETNAFPIRFVRDYDISLPSVSADAERLEQALHNLVVNAVEAMRGSGMGGTVRLRTRVVRDARLAAGPVRQAASIEVEDDGPGVPDAIREQIFYPLVTTRAEGTGLGLALVKSFVEGAGGAVTLESRPGRTVFRVLLPLWHASSSDQNSPSSHGEDHD